MIHLDGMKPYPMRSPQEKHTAYLARLGRLKEIRSPLDTHWSTLGRHILPRSPRFFASDNNRTSEGNYKSIYDNAATLALRVLVSGMTTGMTSPAKPWFRLTTRDPDLRKSHNVGMWLDEVTDRMLAVFARSNVYRMLPKMYADLGCFGTSCSLVLPDFDTVIRGHHLPIGEYYLQQDYQGRITTLYREFERTVGEVVKEFGLENCSTRVQQAFHRRNLEAPVEIVHVIEPQEDQDRRPGSPSSKDMPWRSVYFETGQPQKMLRESGFRRMRVLAPRWQVDGNDVYGGSPAMDALGDILQLQQMQLRLSTAIDYQTKPPIQVPQEMQGRSDLWLPGGTSYYKPGEKIPFNQTGAHGGIRNAFQVDLRLDYMERLIEKVEHRIGEALFKDMFLLFANVDQARMTVPEVMERQAEKFTVIGPVVERLTNELLEPLIDLTFAEMYDVGALPPPPQELVGTELEIEFVSVLAQAQKAVGITQTSQFISETINAAVAAQRPDILDKVNFDAWVDSNGKMRGVPTDLLVDDQSVEGLRKARAEAQAAAEQAQMAQMQASTVKDLANSPAGEGSVLSEAVGAA